MSNEGGCMDNLSSFGGKNIQSVSRAIAIMEYLSKCRKGEKLTQISQDLGLNKSTTHSLITTLERMGYVEQDQETSKYSLGLKLFELGQVVHANMDLRNIAMPFLRELAQKFGETVHLAILSKDEVVYIDKVDTLRSIRIGSQIGGRNAAYCTGVGKVLLAGLTDKELGSLLVHMKLEKLTSNTIVDKEELLKHLVSIRKNGFAMDQEEIEVGLTCVAAPIKNHRGKVIASISVSGPSSRMQVDVFDLMTKDVMDTAVQISRRLGYKG